MNKKVFLEEKSKLERDLIELERDLIDVNNKLNIIKKKEEDEIKRKDSVKNKTKLSQLTSNDRVFKISYVFWKKEVTWAGYVDVNHCKYDEEDDYYMFGVSHKIEPEGFSNGFPTKYKDKHCVLLDFTSKLYFITMKPETWEEDMEESLKEYIATKKERYNKNIKNFKKHVGLMSKNYKHKCTSMLID